jgi:hypothetical protein
MNSRNALEHFPLIGSDVSSIDFEENSNRSVMQSLLFKNPGYLNHIDGSTARKLNVFPLLVVGYDYIEISKKPDLIIFLQKSDDICKQNIVGVHIISALASVYAIHKLRPQFQKINTIDQQLVGNPSTVVRVNSVELVNSITFGISIYVGVILALILFNNKNYRIIDNNSSIYSKVSGVKE